MGKTEEDLLGFAQKLWSRGSRPDLLSILSAAKAEGISINMDRARPLIDIEGSRGTFFCPEFIPRFIAAYLKDSAPRSILDAWVGTGGMLAPLVRILEPSVAVGLSRVVEEHDIARLLYDDPPIDWRPGDPFLLLDDIDGRFDVVVGCLPWGMRRASLTLAVEGRPVEVRDSLEHLVMLKALMLLEPDGVGFFVLGPRFLQQPHRGDVRSVLAQARLFIEAALALPTGTFAPVTGVRGDLVILRKRKPAQLFVGELSQDSEQSRVLLENLRARRPGRAPQLGALVDEESFQSLKAVAAQRDMKRLADDLGLPSRALSDVAVQVNLARRGAEEEFLDVPNAVYLPLIGRSPAVSSLGDLQLKPHNYAQIVLNPEKATAFYLANSLNTPLGQLIRESLSTGFIPKISKSRLLAASIYLPDLPTQTEVVRIHSLITDSSTQLAILQRQLWNAPTTADEVERAVRSLDPEVDFETWIESLPFPLASILWAFHAESSAHRRVGYLFDFFEALAQFSVMVMLSAFTTDRVFYKEHSTSWLDTEAKHRDWIMTPTFGNWVVVGRRLAKTTRTLLNVPEERARCLELFGSSDSVFAEMLASKKLFGILDEVANHRNLWKAHGGIEGAQESERRLNTLAASLSEVRELVSDRYTRVMLLSPGTCEFEEGVYNYEVKSLMGVRVPFKKVAVRTLAPMDKRGLYLLDKSLLKPVELVPLVRFGPGPETEEDACYFYNRRGPDGIRWVSYHFEKKPELTLKDTDVESALSLLWTPAA